MKQKIPTVAIIGKTNVGKSSLFNSIIHQNRSIIAREEGTTRDSVTELTSYKDYNFWLVDTAGLKKPEDEFELTIREQIEDAINYADIIWLVVEANTVISDEERVIAKKSLKSKKPVILIINKIDQAYHQKQNYFQKLAIKPIFETSVTQQKGINELLDFTITQMVKISKINITNQINVSLIGRPNVGKSSLFNSLAKKQQAIIANQAGTTRDINKIKIKYHNHNFNLLDTAGIRRNGKIKVGIEKFSVLRSLNAIQESDICLLVLDANELNIQLDQKLAGIIKNSVKGLILVINKWDLIDKKLTSQENILKILSNNFDFVPWAPVIFTSTLTGQNITKILDISLEIYQSRQIKIPTNKLNQWLQTATLNNPPAGLKNKNPKLNYMIQEKNFNFPSFQIFGAQTNFIHWSYKRYLERRLRETFGFYGTAIKIWYIEKKYQNPKDKNITK